ncbi:hypothetical protein RF11_06588 [Thelohanellus kitauei]|uniref:Uncharacterized protein n=1 Tax=Thelohanellus kitauei TaxID=669202 RepID=A0A0C2JQR0_THEKT|nr:hypothetical protein RF11_06588 [Thelohanellus kitauei]
MEKTASKCNRQLLIYPKNFGIENLLCKLWEEEEIKLSNQIKLIDVFKAKIKGNLISFANQHVSKNCRHPCTLFQEFLVPVVQRLIEVEEEQVCIVDPEKINDD